MKNELLATEGGNPVIKKPFPIYKSIGTEEIKAANKVLKSKTLSGFIGAKGEGFLGGPEVKLLEEEACKIFNVKHVRSKWVEHLNFKQNWHYQLWNVLIFQAWLKEN